MTDMMGGKDIFELYRIFFHFFSVSDFDWSFNGGKEIIMKLIKLIICYQPQRSIITGYG